MTGIFLSLLLCENVIQRKANMVEIWDKLHLYAAAYNILLRHILTLEGM